MLMNIFPVLTFSLLCNVPLGEQNIYPFSSWWILTSLILLLQLSLSVLVFVWAWELLTDTHIEEKLLH